MKVIILCGGQGTRLREESEYRPKPLVDVGGRPILWHIMKLYAHYGYRDFIMSLGYKGSMIKEYFLNYEAMNNDFTIHLGKKSGVTYHDSHEEQDFNVTLADTGLDVMTGARVKKLQRYINDEAFLVTYGDGVSNVDIPKLIAFHRSHGKLATMTTVQPFSRFGVVELDQKGQVQGFTEKPQEHSWANAGFFVFNKGVFDYLDENPDCIMENRPLKRLAEDGELMAYRHDGFFFAMDTYREYLQLNELWKSGHAPWAVWLHPETKTISSRPEFPEKTSRTPRKKISITV